MNNISIIPMDPTHFKEVNNIRNFYIKNTDFNLSSIEICLESFAEKMIKSKYPKIVAFYNNKIIGFAYLQSFRKSDGYKNCGELSIYIANEHINFGFGSILMKEILRLGKEFHLHTVVSLITNENEKSIDFHLKFGFEKSGCMKQVGTKNDVFFDVTILTIIL